MKFPYGGGKAKRHLFDPGRNFLIIFIYNSGPESRMSPVMSYQNSLNYGHEVGGINEQKMIEGESKEV